MLTMTRQQYEGNWYIVLTPDDPAFPPVAIECTGEKPCASQAWMISKNSRNVIYDDPDPEAYMKRK